MKRNNSKVDTIISLRSKILELRNQLESLQKVDIAISPIRSSHRLTKDASKEKITPSRKHFRNTNPESPIRVYIKSKSKDNISSQFSSLKIQKITNQKQQKFNKQKNQTLRLDLSSLFPKQKVENIYCKQQQAIYVQGSLSRSPSNSRTHSNSSFGRSSSKMFLKYEDDDLETPRFQRTQSIKTYKFPPSNPILNPPEQKIPSRKMFAQKNHSPSNIYLNHCGSNPNMFFSPQNYQMILSNKNRSSKKNISELMGGGLSPNSTKSPKYGQQKKHFARHFNETAGDLIYRY